MIGDNQISVALSNPPPRDPSKSSSSYSSKSSSDNLQRRAPRAFVPRSLQISSARKPDESGGKSASTAVAPKSNQDFRNMFLK